ncbi:MAG: 50S ribosomal protein L23 [Candidatus Diapherotrites archaeon]|nr:50S ribosomal protein L23 [Candidatus Diapherotrites archaeon]
MEKKVETNEQKTKEMEKLSEEELLRYSEIFRYPLISEKSIGMIEKENKITFIVNKKTDKKTIKEAFEKLYNVKVDKVNLINDMKGRKKAIIKINKEVKADSIATKLGLI